MTHVSWAALYEGGTDQDYFDVLIPKVMEEIVATFGVRKSTIPGSPAIAFTRGTIEEVARHACEARDAFHLCFVHSDAGGRNLENRLESRSSSYCDRMHELCDWPLERCIVVAPKHETEAWILADGSAVVAALGYSGTPASIGLPATAAEAERLSDPKATIQQAIRQVRGRRRPIKASELYPAIAQRQSLIELRRTNAFARFERKLCLALAHIGCISWPQS